MTTPDRVIAAHSITELDANTTITTLIDHDGNAYTWVATATGADAIIAYNGLKLKPTNPTYQAIEQYAATHIYQ